MSVRWPFGCYLPVNPCCGTTDPCTPPAQNTSSHADNLIYTGPNLPCTGIDTNDDLETALQKIEQKICEIIAFVGMTTTTTTTIA